MKKLFYICASLLCLALGASMLILSGAGALRLLRSPVEDPAPAAACGPAPVPAASSAQPEATQPEPAKQAETSEQAKVSETRVYVWDLERVLKDSVHGRAVSAYADAYQKVMEKNVTLVNTALADKKKRYNAAEGKKLIAQFNQQRNSVWNDARTIIRGLVRTAAAKTLKDALLIENTAATHIPTGVDKTDELIAQIDTIKLNLPDPPKPILIK